MLSERVLTVPLNSDMKITDQERRKFSLYCKYMADMEQQALKGKESLLEKFAAGPLRDEITKRDKTVIAAYLIVSGDLDKWDEAETITAADVASPGVLDTSP